MPYSPFPPMSQQQVILNRVGPIAYQVMSASDQMKSRIPSSHFKKLVSPTMMKKNASMPKHLGQTPPIMSGKGGLP